MSHRDLNWRLIAKDMEPIGLMYWYRCNPAESTRVETKTGGSLGLMTSSLSSRLRSISLKAQERYVTLDVLNIKWESGYGVFVFLFVISREHGTASSMTHRLIQADIQTYRAIHTRRAEDTIPAKGNKDTGMVWIFGPLSPGSIANRLGPSLYRTK